MKLPQGKNPLKTLSQRVLLDRDRCKVIEEIVELDGKEYVYTFTDSPNSVGIVALNEKGEIALVGQWRNTNKVYSWEVPAGFMDKEGELDPLEAAKRELAEEASVQAEKWTSLGTILREASMSTQQNHLFLAEGISEHDIPGDEDERIEILWIPFEEAVAKVHSGEIYEALSIICILRAWEEWKEN